MSIPNLQALAAAVEECQDPATASAEQLQRTLEAVSYAKEWIKALDRDEWRPTLMRWIEANGPLRVSEELEYRVKPVRNVKLMDPPKAVGFLLYQILTRHEKYLGLLEAVNDSAEAYEDAIQLLCQHLASNGLKYGKPIQEELGKEMFSQCFLVSYPKDITTGKPVKEIAKVDPRRLRR